MSLRVALQVDRPGFRLDVALDAEPGEVVAVLGPNGAGKSTLLRALSGLLPLTGGRVELAGRLLDGDGVRVAPQDRRVGMVFQDYRLFPHLSALDNVAFGLRSTGAGRAAARAAAQEWLDRLGLGGLERRRPDRLSGGQAQRVALARALCTAPDLLLLDEPLAALDVTTRLEVRTELRRALAGFGGVALLVTHDPLEALSLADRLVLLEDGRVTQDAPAAEIARRPRTAYAARLVGLNLFRGTAAGGRLRVTGGGELVLGDASLDGPALAVARPSSVLLERQRPSGSSARNVLAGTVSSVEGLGDRVRVTVASSPPVLADITADALAELRLAAGDEVWVSLKATDLACYPDPA
ncbi:MAG: sulfate/molybdate ABC transporter ATP-binding protein [Mycobacteriales bacterium]